MSFTLRQLQYFVAVAQKGSVSGAAQSLSISQSSVTEAIKELEADLGVAILPLATVENEIRASTLRAINFTESFTRPIAGRIPKPCMKPSVTQAPGADSGYRPPSR